MDGEHQARILDQFGKQAAPFAASPQIRDQDALNRIVDIAGAGPDDTVLDVACGPGLLACAFARVVRHVTGIDVTPQMLEQARRLQREQRVTNATWRLGDVQSLPFPEAAFSIVSCRFAFHHFLDPLRVLKEMRRVCQPGGRVVVADSAPSAETAEAFNEMERLRDPSHVRALPVDSLLHLFEGAGLRMPRVARHALPYQLEPFLARSFPGEGDADRIRRLFAESLEHDRLGLAPVRKDGDIGFSYPTAIIVASRTD